jgi:hypothetical protein
MPHLGKQGLPRRLPLPARGSLHQDDGGEACGVARWKLIRSGMAGVIGELSTVAQITSGRRTASSYIFAAGA